LYFKKNKITCYTALESTHIYYNKGIKTMMRTDSKVGEVATFEKEGLEKGLV
jgi:hypothetical protein